MGTADLTSAGTAIGRAGAAQPDGYRPGYSVAAEQILAFIDAEGLGPGDRLPTEAQFAQLLGVSRGIARDAIKTLAATGRISTQRGRGIFVASPPASGPDLLPDLLPGLALLGQPAGDGNGLDAFIPTDIDHIMMLFEFRGVQDRAAAELASRRATPAQIVAIEESLSAFCEATESADPVRAGQADEAFHRAVTVAAQNSFLLSAVTAGQALQRRVVEAVFGGFSGGSWSQAMAEHAQIVAAIRSGDAAGAASAAFAHVDRTRLSYQAEIGRRVFQGR